MLATLVVAGAWSLTLGTVAVVHLGRLVDALTLATAAPASTAPAGFEALPVEWSRAATAELGEIAEALHGMDGGFAVHLRGTIGLERALCAIARAIGDAAPSGRFRNTSGC